MALTYVLQGAPTPPPFPKRQSRVLKRVWLLFQGAQAERWQSAPGHGTRAGDPAAAHTAGLGEHL